MHLQKKVRNVTVSLTKMRFPEKILLLLSCVVLFVVCQYIFTEGNLWMHSDSASVVTLANEMIRTRQLFPDGWHYGTTVSLLSFPICLFLMMGADYILAHDIAQLLFAVLMLISIVLFSRKFFHDNSWLLMVPLLFTEISAVQYEMFFIQAAYSGFIFIMFFSLSCFAEASELKPFFRIRRRRGFLFLSYIAFSALLGSVFLQQITLPLCGALIICGIMDMSPSPRICEIKGPVCLCLIISGVSIAGCILYSLICSQIHIGKNLGLTTFRGSYSEIIENISITVQAFLCNMGISGNVSLFSFQGIANMLRIILTGAIWIVFPLLSFKNLKNEPEHVRIFHIFSMLHIAEVLVLLLFCDSVDYIANARYQLTALVLLSTISCRYVYERFIRKDCLSGWMCSILFATISFILTIPVANISGWQEGLSNMQKVTDYLSENGLHYGYATFWNAGNNTVLSNGEVQISPVYVGTKSVAPYLSLASEDWYAPEYFEGRTFLMLTDDETATFAPDGYNYTDLWTAETVLNYPPYTILVYDHNISRNNFNDMLGGEANLLGKAACSVATMRQENGEILIGEGQIMYGPYIPLSAGKYLLTVDATLVSPVEIVVSAADADGEALGIYELTSGRNEFQFTLDEYHSQVEFVVRNQTAQTVHVTGMYLLLNG